MFSKGQKVVCINDDFSNLIDGSAKASTIFPKKDTVYNIRKVSSFGLLLEEIVNEEFVFVKHNNLVTEPEFSANRFVPLLYDFQKVEFSKVIEEAMVSAS